jgi:hypothetical protein
LGRFPKREIFGLRRQAERDAALEKHFGLLALKKALSPLRSASAVQDGLFRRQQKNMRRLIAVAGEPAVLLAQLDDLNGTAALLGAVFARVRPAPAGMREVK